MQMNHINSLIAGVRTSNDKVFSVVNPYSKETIARVSITSVEQIALAVSEAKKEVENLLPAYEIHSILMAAAVLIRQRSDDFVKTLVQETGFSVADARGEISRGLDTLVTSAEEAKRLRGDTVPMNANPAQDHRLALTIRVPVGVVCAITPFNSPFNAVMHKLGPALAGGNAVLLKPSEHAPLTPSLICDALLDAGLPPARISLVNGGAEVGRALLAHQGIDFYTFTGSTAVGRIVQAGAGLRRTSWSWEASHVRWSAVTPICTRPFPRSPVPRFEKPGRYALRSSGCMWSEASFHRFRRRLSRRRKSSKRVIRPTRIRVWAP